MSYHQDLGAQWSRKYHFIREKGLGRTADIEADTVSKSDGECRVQSRPKQQSKGEWATGDLSYAEQ